ncbi:hypothetical protein IEO21_10941 [Rhodonia placenta]|uniref:Uncharacterized protein n=1 Tax=Rhodonia placenta TaxID=104341 RepID=A0A8H7TWY6_9APHY|nr:hypothetical protein IEO21_10941 [Postia placenta]
MGQEVETEVPRTAEAGLYTGEDKGRLCALVCAQLVRAQHADAAPGAVDNDLSIRVYSTEVVGSSPQKGKIKKTARCRTNS